MPCLGFTPNGKRKLESAAGIASSFFPYLSGLLRKLDIRFDWRVDTAAVTPSGKLLFNPGFFHALAPGLETAFILAHEALHLAQMIFERGKHFPDQESLNIAHDILINGLLCDTMGIPVPPRGGLSWKWFLEFDEDSPYEDYTHMIPGIPAPAANASAYSLEEMVRIIVSVKGTPAHPGRRSWSAGPVSTDEAEGSKITLDMLSEEAEEKLFPDEDRKEREKVRIVLQDLCRRAAARCAILSRREGGGDGGGFAQAVDIVRSCYVPPWEMVMQRWFDGLVIPKRSWGHASRRGAWRNDVVLPGRDQECYTLHIVLDTSGSMAKVIPSILGKIGIFARNVGMEQVHIVQCDAEVTEDEFVEIGQLENYVITGYGDSDMSPAMLKLAEDPDVTAVLVVTDGYISYPPEEKIPYDVLWCLPETNTWATLPYGRTAYIPFS